MRYALYGLHRGSSVDPDRLARRAVRAEQAGFESLWVGDHIALPDDAPDAADEPRLEALVALTYLAAATTHLRLGVGVLVLPQRQPVLLAKQLTSLDVLSNGRLIVGIGAGHVERELRALGVDPRVRGAMTDEFIDAIVTLWAADTRFEGRWVAFDNVSQRPRPHQSPLPLVIGGHSDVAMTRAARVGAGWFGWDLDVNDAERSVQRLAALRADVGPAGAPRLEITVKPKHPTTPDLVAALAAAGVDRIVLEPASTTDDSIDRLIDETGEMLV